MRGTWWTSVDVRLAATRRGARGVTAALPFGSRLNDAIHVVKRRYASQYFWRVRSTTSGGNSGGGLFLSHGVVSSQSRTICLSNDGGLTPTRYSSAGQKRELSGVSTSSIRM